MTHSQSQSESILASEFSPQEATSDCLPREGKKRDTGYSTKILHHCFSPRWQFAKFRDQPEAHFPLRCVGLCECTNLHRSAQIFCWPTLSEKSLSCPGGKSLIHECRPPPMQPPPTKFFISLSLIHIHSQKKKHTHKHTHAHSTPIPNTKLFVFGRVI